MALRRLASVVAAATLAFSLSVPALAQEGGAPVTIHLSTCMVTGTASSIHISASGTPPDALRDCREGWTEFADLLAIDGIAADSITDTTAEWQFIEDGDHVTTAPIGGELDFTVAGEPVELWAYYAQNVIPTDDETGDRTAGENDSSVHDSTDGGDTSGASTSDDDAVIADLPRTGHGPVVQTGTTFALVTSGLIAASVVSMAGSRAVRQR